MKTKFISIVSIILAFLFVAGSAGASPQYTALGTGFTYQGSLTDGGVPADGLYDLSFELYDADVAGSVVAPLIPMDDVTVTNGLFTVQLDFGDVFNGTALWLEIGVRPFDIIGVYTKLAPRQALTATPYAMYSARVPWSGLMAVPAGFADGVDDVASYQNMVVVAKSGGDYTTITAALNNITASSGNRFLIYVAPGVYSEQVTMEPYVDIQGSGELNTKITASDSATTLTGENYAELRFLTVENTGGSISATAIYNNNTSPRLTHVTATVADGVDDNYGVYNYGATPTMTDVTVVASGGESSFGVANDLASPTMTNVTTSASGGTSNNYGVYNASSSPTMTNVMATASGGEQSYGVYGNGGSPMMKDGAATASGATNNYGVYLDNSGAAVRDVSITASGSGTNQGVYLSYGSTEMADVIIRAYGSGSNYGVYNYWSSPTMTNVSASASEGTSNIGVYSVASDIRLNNSHISGSSNTILTSFSDMRVGASLFSGGPVSGGVTCAGVYDENYTFYAGPACPP